MPMLRGIETLAIGRTKTIELTYERGAYVDRRGQHVVVDDIVCFDCGNAYYALSEEPIAYCPHCGRREGKAWSSIEDARAWAREYNFDYLKKLGLTAVACRKSNGAWVLGFAASTEAVIATGKFADARELSL